MNADRWLDIATHSSSRSLPGGVVVVRVDFDHFILAFSKFFDFARFNVSRIVSLCRCVGLNYLSPKWITYGFAPETALKYGFPCISMKATVKASNEGNRVAASSGYEKFNGTKFISSLIRVQNGIRGSAKEHPTPSTINSSGEEKIVCTFSPESRHNKLIWTIFKTKFRCWCCCVFYAKLAKSVGTYKQWVVRVRVGYVLAIGKKSIESKRQLLFSICM